MKLQGTRMVLVALALVGPRVPAAWAAPPPPPPAQSSPSAPFPAGPEGPGCPPLADLQACHLADPCDYNLDHCRYEGAALPSFANRGNMDHVDFAGADLQGAVLSGNTDHANFRGANLAGATLSGNTDHANFAGADLSGTTLAGWQGPPAPPHPTVPTPPLSGRPAGTGGPRCLSYLTLKDTRTGTVRTFDTTSAGANTTFTLDGDSGEFHTSCSQQLCAGDYYGPLVITDLDRTRLEAKFGDCSGAPRNWEEFYSGGGPPASPPRTPPSGGRHPEGLASPLHLHFDAPKKPLVADLSRFVVRHTGANFCSLSLDSFKGTIRNDSGRPIRVATKVSLVVADLRKDGHTIQGEEVPARLHRSPFGAQEESIRELAPHEELPIVAHLCSLVLDPSHQKGPFVVRYPYLGPGHYEVRFEYIYSGADPTVMKGPILTGPIHFEVVEQ